MAARIPADEFYLHIARQGRLRHFIAVIYCTGIVFGMLLGVMLSLLWEVT
jgi:hypothetical protein